MENIYPILDVLLSFTWGKNKIKFHLIIGSKKKTIHQIYVNIIVNMYILVFIIYGKYPSPSHFKLKKKKNPQN